MLHRFLSFFYFTNVTKEEDCKIKPTTFRLHRIYLYRLSWFSLFSYESINL